MLRIPSWVGSPWVRLGADKDNHPGKPRAFEELAFEVAFVEDSHSLVEAYIPKDIEA